MKIFFTALILCVTCSICSVAQTKPTKQETIDWIVAKLREQNSYVGSGNVFGTFCTWHYDYIVQNHTVDVNYRVHGDPEKGSFSFDLDDICKVEINPEESLHCISLTMNKSIPVETNVSGDVRTKNYTTINIFLGQDNLQKRFLMHLKCSLNIIAPK